MAVTEIVMRSKPKRLPPREGDRKTVKGVEYVRRRVYYRMHGQVIGAAVSNGKPVYEWVRA